MRPSSKARRSHIRSAPNNSPHSWRAWRRAIALSSRPLTAAYCPQARHRPLSPGVPVPHQCRCCRRRVCVRAGDIRTFHGHLSMTNAPVFATPPGLSRKDKETASHSPSGHDTVFDPTECIQHELVAHFDVQQCKRQNTAERTVASREPGECSLLIFQNLDRAIQ